jgi:hypothetical protein
MVWTGFFESLKEPNAASVKIVIKLRVSQKEDILELVSNCQLDAVSSFDRFLQIMCV